MSHPGESEKFAAATQTRGSAGRNPTPLVGKVALVTGASGGIGQAISRRLAADGAAVVVHYKCRREPADTLASELARAGVQAAVLRADLARSDEVIALFAQATNQFGGIDIVVANAGVSAPRMPMAEVSDEQFEHGLNHNTRATFFVLREAARRVRTGGRIILIGSSTTVHPAAGFGVYAASKAPGLVLAQVLAAELAGRGITVNQIAAGPTDAGFLDEWPAEAKAPLAAASPFHRLGTPEDTADVVAFLASDDARWLSGQQLVANGAATV